jgi:Tfp pilus assembly protein PilE
MVVVAVIGVLAAITIAGYGAWKKRTYENVVKSDLNSIVAAMENARNFANAYPSSIPSSYEPSANIVAVGGSTNGTSFCVQATSTIDTSVSMYVTNANTNPTAGNCSASTGLVAWFPMNGSASDFSGRANHGTANAVTLAAGQDGRSNGAYSFSGINSYIVHGTNGILPSSGTVSVGV